MTVNQLAQIHEGHQALINEGKYGSYENGTITEYFAVKHNYLGYPLFLPVISLPAYWLIDTFGEHFVFFILYLWTFLLIAIALLLNAYFQKNIFIGKWGWTTGILVTAFILFFINLKYYIPFRIVGTHGYPEIEAIVFTNILLFALLAVMIFIINHSIFEDPRFSFFGTIVCISCSSYLFWTNFCKDHILVVFIFTWVILLVVEYQKTRYFWYLPTAFIFSGLLAWARPELALLVFIALCIFVVYLFLSSEKENLTGKKRLFVFFTPLFTLFGAIPFFINNYLFTKNIFLPTWILWNEQNTTVIASVTTIVSYQQNSPESIHSLLQIIKSGTTIQPSTFLPDLYGVFFNPQTGGIGLFPITPLFFVSVFLVPILIVLGRELRISTKERQYIMIMLLLSFSVFFAYLRGLHGMNTSPGILPDIRYLSPMYLPMNIIGLMLIRKIPIIAARPLDVLKGMLAVWVIVIPITLFIISSFYPIPEIWPEIFPHLILFSSIGVYIFTALFLMSTIACIFFRIPEYILMGLLAILCSIPLIWQIDATFLARLFGNGLGGYSFWIPIVRMIFAGIF